MSLRTPIELGLAAYMIGFHGALTADTQAMQEFAARDVAKSIVWVPGRMIDDVEKMIAEWRKNQNNAGPGLSSMLPVVFLGLDKNYMPVLPEFSVATPTIDLVFPDDELGRVYRCATLCNEYKAQVVFVSPEAGTAHSLLLQFNAWTTQGPTGRRFATEYEFAGFKSKWPAVLEAIDIGGVATPVDQTNLTIHVADLTIRATVPLFTAPGASEPNDGKAAPAGYPVVVDIEAIGTLAGALGTQPGVSISTTLDDEGNIVQVRT
jgi:hypothetical protein